MACNRTAASTKRAIGDECMTQPQSTIQQVIAAQRAALLRGDVATLARYAAQWQQVEAALADKAELLAHELAQLEADGETISQARLYQLARYQAFIQQARAEIDKYAQNLAPELSQQQAALADQGVQDAISQIAAITGSFLQLSTGATNVAIGYAADGSPLVNLLRATWPDAASAMTQALIQGVAAGYSPRKTARQMQEASGAGLNRMLTVARTETLRAYRESSRDAYQKAGVKRYMRIAARDARTCMLCISLDGTIYEVSEPMPVHPSCRCTSVALVDGYKVNTGQTGAEWFAEQDTATQQQILGTRRYQLYAQGTPLRAFAQVVHDDTWGATLREAPLINLQ